jgi:hypothetical protein
MAGHGTGFRPETTVSKVERPYTRLERERNYFREQCKYWKRIATDKNDATYRDGMLTGVACTLGAVLVGGASLLLIFG